MVIVDEFIYSSFHIFKLYLHGSYVYGLTGCLIHLFLFQIFSSRVGKKIGNVFCNCRFPSCLVKVRPSILDLWRFLLTFLNIVEIVCKKNWRKMIICCLWRSKYYVILWWSLKEINPIFRSSFLLGEFCILWSLKGSSPKNYFLICESTYKINTNKKNCYSYYVRFPA